MKRLIAICLVIATIVTIFSRPTSATDILSLDASRTGNEDEEGDNRYLTSQSMQDATQILYNAGFTIATTSLFDAAHIGGAKVLYTGAVSVPFSDQEISDIQAFVSSGGGLVMLRDWNGYYEAADPLAAAFGATYNQGPFGLDGTAAVNMTLSHPIWNGPAGSVTSYDQVISSSVSGVTGIGVHQTNPDQVGLAVTSFGNGRVVFLTDIDAWDGLGDGGDTVAPLPGNHNAIVWENIFHWAAAPEPTTICLLGIGGLLLGRRKFNKKQK